MRRQSQSARPAQADKSSEMQDNERNEFAHHAGRHNPGNRRGGFHRLQLCAEWLAPESSSIINLDKLTYAGNLRIWPASRTTSATVFVQGDICDRELIAKV